MPAEQVRLPALSRLIALSILEFSQRFWDRSPLVTRRSELAGDFGDLLSSAIVDSLISERALRQPFYRMVDHAKAVTGLTRSAVAGDRTIVDLADPDAVARAYSEGATLVLQSLHRMWPPIGALCRDLSAELGHQTQCNAYLTPAGDAQGFAYHHDTHDVFVVQVEGSKRWVVHRPVIDHPARDQPRSGEGLVAEGQVPLLDVVLAQGDTLYLPRGYVHAARTTDESSVHLTVGVIPTTWLDVLKDAVARLASEELPLRRALPVAPTDSTGAHEAAELLALATDWLAKVRPAQVADLVEQRRAKAQVPEPLGMVRQADALRSLTPSSPVRVRRGLGHRVVAEDGRVTVVLAAKQIRLPRIAEGMLGRLLDGQVTTPRAAVVGDPDCTEADAVVVVGRLLREGVLVTGGPAR